jgi:hypothetical protein
MQQGVPHVTAQQIVDEAFPYLGRGSYFQTTAYDTHLFISGSDTYDPFHKFELFGRKILWINQVQDEVMGEMKTIMPRTIFPCSENDFDGHIVAHRLASLLCYVTQGTFINPRIWVGIAHPAPATNQPAEKYVHMHYGHEQIDAAINRLHMDTFTDKRWAALAHYRQATLAETPYYKVLSYWKILELYFNNVNPDMNTYINDLYASRPDIFHDLGSFTGTASRKLRSIRNKSAHFMLNGDTTIEDPDNPDIYNEVSKGLFSLRRLAEGLIERSAGW